MNEDDAREGSTEDLLRAAPGLVRIAGEAWWRATAWTVGASARASSRVLRAALSGEAPGDLFSTSGAEARAQLPRLLGVEAAGREPLEAGEPPPPTDDSSAAGLRAPGAQPPRPSADGDLEEDTHPAYARILTPLAPDEG